LLTNIKYLDIFEGMNSIYNSENKEHQKILAYHYGMLGFNAVSAEKMIKCEMNEMHINRHLVHLDSLYYENSWISEVIMNDFSNIPRGNCDLTRTEEFEIIFDDNHLNPREIGIYINILPYINILKNRFNIKSIKINCNDRLKELFEIYFPYIEIGTSKNKVTQYEVLEYVYNNGGSSALRNSIKNISKKLFNNKNPYYVGINWFSNKLSDRHRSIPIGTLINTVGKNKKKLNVMSLQYNETNIETDIYNRHSSNKIKNKFENDINTSVIDILNAVSNCYMFVGIQSEASVMAYSLCGIPTIITSGSPHFYWYFLNQQNPYINIARMRYQGDFGYIEDTINKLI